MSSRSPGKAVTRLLITYILLGLLLSACSSPPEMAVQGVPLTEITSFGSNPGNLRMFRFVPSGLPAGAPLVVALHGCTQSAAAYADGAGWPKYAARDGFALVFPEQKSANNRNACFNWFEPADITRGSGEALSIKQMVDKMKAAYNIDPARVFVTGLSAGGFMTTVMLASYPEVFAGGGVIAGGPYKCATSLTQAFTCMSPGVDKTPRAWGDLIRGASNHTGPWPVVSIWHGTADYTVKDTNMREAMEGWTDVHGADAMPDISNTVKGYPHKVYQKDGRAVVETYSLTGMGHGTPVDPGAGEDQCGQAGAYILDVNICSSYYLGMFWGIIGGANGGGGGGDEGGGEQPTTCWTTTNKEHHGAARAVMNGTPPWENYSATGSYEWLGYAGDVTTLVETRPDYFNKVAACP